MPQNIPLTDRQAAIVKLVAQWRATPEAYRAQKSLRELALANGIQPTASFYAMADSPEVWHQILVETAGGAMGHAPAILQALANKAISGHVQAAEVYLDFVRKTITDEGLIRHLRPTSSFESLLMQVQQATDKLLDFVRDLPADETAAKSYLQQIAVDAQTEAEPPLPLPVATTQEQTPAPDQQPQPVGNDQSMPE